MNRRAWLWAGSSAFVVVLLWLVIFALRNPTDDTAGNPDVPAGKPVRPVRVQRETLPDEPVNETSPVYESGAFTNAADAYRQVFASYDSLPKDEKGILADWRTNVAEEVATELCEKIHPICDLLHQAGTMTNCDWGLGPITIETPLKPVAEARGLARMAIWSATHCQRENRSVATDDVLSAVRLGQQVSHIVLVGYLVDVAIRDMAFSCMAAKLDQFRGVDGQRLVAAFDDPAFADALVHVMELEGVITDRYAAKLASLSPAEVEKQWSLFGDDPGKFDPATISKLKQAAEMQHQLAKLVATGSDAEIETWFQRAKEMQAADPVADMLLGGYKGVLDKAQRIEVKRMLVEAGLAVAANGTTGLVAYPDPATGEPFTYREVSGGFELQSAYQFTNQPLKMVFSLSPP